MKKIKFKYHLKNEDLLTEFEGDCYFYEEKNVLVFVEDNGTQVFIDYKHSLLTRENDEMLLVLDFNEKSSYVEMKKMNKRMDLDLKVDKKELNDNKFMVNYTLSGQNKFEFVIEWFPDDE